MSNLETPYRMSNFQDKPAGVGLDFGLTYRIWIHTGSKLGL